MARVDVRCLIVLTTQDIQAKTQKIVLLGMASMTALNLALSNNLPLIRLAADYQRNGRIHVPTVLEGTAAECLLRKIEAFDAWDIHLNQGINTFDVFPEQRKAMAPTQLNDLRIAAYAGAQKGFQYFYENYPIYDAYHAGCCAEPFIEEIFDFVNSEAFLGFMRTLTGHKNITFADAQLTRFSPGDFLTSHDDNVYGKDRLAAYVINLTPDWRADFGGILQFFDGNDNVEVGFTPAFNAINVFSIPKPHAVSQVSTFAPRARYSITGWLRSGFDPKA